MQATQLPSPASLALSTSAASSLFSPNKGKQAHQMQAQHGLKSNQTVKNFEMIQEVWLESHLSEESS